MRGRARARVEPDQLMVEGVRGWGGGVRLGGGRSLSPGFSNQTPFYPINVPVHTFQWPALHRKHGS